MTPLAGGPVYRQKTWHKQQLINNYISDSAVRDFYLFEYGLDCHHQLDNIVVPTLWTGAGEHRNLSDDEDSSSMISDLAAL